MHGTIIGHKSEEHDRRRYKIRVTKTGCTITRTKKHVKDTPISADDCLRNEMSIAI